MLQPAPKKHRTLKIVLGVTGIVLAGCCGLVALGSGSDNSRADGTITSPQPAVSAPPDNMTCRAVDPRTGGVYYLSVSSGSWRTLTACNGHEPYDATVGELLDLPGVDRRCFAPDNYFPHQLVAVYSGRGLGLTAAEEFCRAVGGSNG